ncbi:MAG TPA: hypothetical protein VF774_26515, partial [Pseudoduganella sp.]
DIGMVFRQMLGNADAQAYLRGENVPEEVIQRVLAGETIRVDQLETEAAVLEPPANQVDLQNVFYGHSGRRRNMVMAAIVQAALLVSDQLGRDRAERLLRREAVPDEIIARVLAGDGANRRARQHAM